MPPTRPVSIGCIRCNRRRVPPTSGLRKRRPRACIRVCDQLPSLRVAPGTVQPPPAESTRVWPTCQRPSPASTAARTGLACSSLKRNDTVGSASSGSNSSTLRIGLRSTITTMRRMSDRPSTETVIGTVIGSTAKPGPSTLTRSSKTTGWLPRNSRRMSPQVMVRSGSPSKSSSARACHGRAASPVRASAAQRVPATEVHGGTGATGGIGCVRPRRALAVAVSLLHRLVLQRPCRRPSCAFDCNRRAMGRLDARATGKPCPT